MRQIGSVALVVSGLLLLGVAIRGDDDRGFREDSRVERGFQISPVPVHVTHNNRDLVGLGSYIVNAQAGCNDCHTCPSYSVDPYQPGNGRGKVNSANFLAGGVAFATPGGTFVSANLTPDPQKNNLPDDGHTFEQFKRMLRTGHDADPPHALLQIMPWPIYGNMTDGDLHAVYEYLKAIPPAQPGTDFGPTCPAPGLAKPGA
jgi:hypothetical protein